MTPEDAQQLQAYIQGIAQIFYKNTSEGDLVSLEAIEKSVRQQMLEHVSPQVAFFYRTSHRDSTRQSPTLEKLHRHHSHQQKTSPSSGINISQPDISAFREMLFTPERE